MAITAAMVNELRQSTGLGMMECKKALEEAGGDMQKAIDLLRKKGLAKMAERADRANAEGRVGAVIAPDKSKGALVEINTETDFTAKSDTFVKMVADIAAEALKQPAGDVTVTPAIQTLIDNVKLTTKENVQFGRGKVVGGPGRTVGSYVHFTGKTGVLVEFEGPATPELQSDLCMHVTAANPVPIAVIESEVPADVVAKEREIAKAQAIEQGKPEQIAEKMVEGKIRKFYEERVLIHQISVKHMDEKKKIKDLLPKGTTVKSFVRYQVGSR